jgi:hypothetical protein
MFLCECRLGSGWRGIVNGEYMDVWAGAYKYDADQGVLLVFTRTLTLSRSSGERPEYTTPARVGSVRIVAADGLRLTLEAGNGQQFIFDAGTRQWVSP